MLTLLFAQSEPAIPLSLTETAATGDAVSVTLAASTSLVETAAAADTPTTAFSITINLTGPSTTPGAPEVTPAEINRQVNAALAAVIAQASLVARGQAPITPFLADGATFTRTPAARAGDVHSPLDFGAFGDGNSHPASTVYPSLAACQAVYPFATDLAQEIDWLAWQAALYAGGRTESRPLHYIMCNDAPASMTCLTVIAGLTYVEGNGAILDWSAMRTQPNETHFVGNYDFSQGGDGWVNDVVDPSVSAPVFEDNSAYCADPPSFCRFGQQVTLQPGHYVLKWAYTATLGGSYPENPSPPYGQINFWSDAPGAGNQWPYPLPQALGFPSLTAVITAGADGVSVAGSFNFNITETFTSYVCFTGGGYANWRVTLLDIIPYVPNCGITVTRDGNPPEYYNIYKSIKGLELIGGGAAQTATPAAGSLAPGGIVFESFVNQDGNLVDFEDCSLHNWGNAIWPRDGGYLLEFRNCIFYNNDVAVFFNGAQNAGENIRFYGGGIFNNLFGIMNPHPYGEFTFYGTALDYNYGSISYNAGRLEFHGCHIENNLKDAPIFHCAGGSIMLYGGNILGVAPRIDPSLVVPPVKLDDSNSLMTVFGTQMYNLSSADGTFVAGPGTFRAYGWINTGNPSIQQPSKTTISMDPLGGVGNLEPFEGSPFIAPDPTGIYLEGGVYATGSATFTDRWTADFLTIALTTAQFHTGTRSLAVTKTTLEIGSADYQIIFLIPVRQGQDANLAFFWLAPNEVEPSLAVASITYSVDEFGDGLATVTTTVAHGLTIAATLFLYISGADQAAYNGTVFCTVTTTIEFTYPVSGAAPVSPATGTILWSAVASLYARTYWAKQIGTDALGKPVLSPANTFKGENDIQIPLCGLPDWKEFGTGTEYGPAVTTPETGNSPGAPVWATHMAVILDTESLPAMQFFLDDFVSFII